MGWLAERMADHLETMLEAQQHVAERFGLSAEGEERATEGLKSLVSDLHTFGVDSGPGQAIALQLKDWVLFSEAEAERVSRRIYFKELAERSGQGGPGSLRTKRMRKKRAKALGIDRPPWGWS